MRTFSTLPFLLLLGAALTLAKLDGDSEFGSGSVSEAIILDGDNQSELKGDSLKEPLKNLHSKSVVAQFGVGPEVAEIQTEFTAKRYTASIGPQQDGGRPGGLSNEETPQMQTELEELERRQASAEHILKVTQGEVKKNEAAAAQAQVDLANAEKDGSGEAILSKIKKRVTVYEAEVLRSQLLVDRLDKETSARKLEIAEKSRLLKLEEPSLKWDKGKPVNVQKQKGEGEANDRDESQAQKDVPGDKKKQSIIDEGQGEITIEDLPKSPIEIIGKRISLKGKIAIGAVGITAFTLGVVALVYYFKEGNLDHFFGGSDSTSAQQEQTKDKILKAMTKPQEILADRCNVLHASATRVEALGENASSAKDWKYTLDSLGPVYDSSVKQATEAGIANLTMRGFEDWSGFKKSSYLGLADDTEGKKANNSSPQNGQDQAMAEWLQTMYFKYHFTRQHHETTQDVAFNLMIDSTDLPFETNSEHFYRAYTAISSRVSIPDECHPHIHEDRSTIHQYTKSRALQADLRVQTQTELDAHFGLFLRRLPRSLRHY